MAAEEQTFTVDTSVPTETLTDNLTTDEQDSLAVGEKMVAEQEKLLAGKYKDAEQLEKAYIELQKKLGDGEETEVAEAEPEEKPKLSDGAALLTNATDEYYKNGNKLSPETLSEVAKMSSQDLVNAYLEVQSNPEFQSANAEPVAEISESEINQIKNSAGGEASYANIINWSKSNLDKSAISAFDQVVETGSIEAIKLAVSGLKAQYDNANGVEGRMVTGKTAPPSGGDVFRSQAELVSAMNDRRYDSDPAYRQDVIEKLDRSNLDF